MPKELCDELELQVEHCRIWLVHGVWVALPEHGFTELDLTELDLTELDLTGRLLQVRERIE